MKKLIIILLIIFVLGLWFYTEATKDTVRTVGGAVIDKTLDVGEKAADIARDKIQEKLPNE